MKIYCVGGYIRDILLHKNPKDMDFVVVGASSQDLIEYGKKLDLEFKQVGNDFPIYIDKLGREWALARKDYKISPGYKGFKCTFDTNVTLEEDLFRRDITINSFALEVINIKDKYNIKLDKMENIIDPYNGMKDLDNGILRHISDHFIEDPVRVLRIARFAAKYHFAIAPETILLINRMVDNGELDHLVPERVWTELEKAMAENNPSEFFIALKATKAFDHLFPQLRENFYHNIQKAFNKAIFTEEKIAILVSSMMQMEAYDFLRWFVPKKLQKFALDYNQLLRSLEKIDHLLNAISVENIFITVNAYKNKDFFNNALCVDEYFGTNTPYFENICLLSEIFDETVRIGYDDLTSDQQSQLVGPEIGDAIQKLRRNSIKNFLKEEG